MPIGKQGSQQDLTSGGAEARKAQPTGTSPNSALELLRLTLWTVPTARN